MELLNGLTSHAMARIDTHCTQVSQFENITVRNLHVDRISGNGAAYTIVGLPMTGV